jgi:hypothetical protein
MTLDEVLSLKAEMESAFEAPPRAGLTLVQKRIDEGRVSGFVRRLFDAPVRHLPLLLETNAPIVIRAAKLERWPRGDIVQAALLAQGDRAGRATPHLSIGYSAIGKKDYRAEVRIQDPDVRTVLLAQQIVHRAKGQAHVGQYFGLTAHAARSADGGAEALPIGSSVGHRKSPPGTIGLFLRSADGIGVVSNSHILAWCGRAKAGDPILAPHPNDADSSREIGKLRRFSSLIHDDVIALDMAFAVLNDGAVPGGNVVPKSLPDAGKSIKSGARLPVESIGLAVRKIGLTSGSTRGTLAAFNAGPKLIYEGLAACRT